MPQIANFRLLLSSSSPSAAAASPFIYSFPFKFSFPSKLAPRHRPFLTVVSSHLDRRGRRGGGESVVGGFFTQRRRASSSTEGERGKEMEKKEGMGYNRKRAEGRDGSSKKNLQVKVRKLNPINTICYVQILGTGMDTQDTSPSVLLFFDKQRMIFNAGEGLQRFCTEHKIKLSKIDHMFLTRVCSETAGGLPGLLLTLAGIGEEGMSVNVWGPSDLKYLVDAMRSFIPNAAMVHSHSFGETTNGNGAASSSSDFPHFTEPIVLIDDEVVRLSAILLCPRLSLPLERKTDCFSVLGSLKGKTSALKPGDVSVIYACELSEIKGKFDPAKAEALGLKRGPKYRELQLGKSVMSDSHPGTMVHPSDVLGSSIPGPIVLLVDCPTPSHLLELLSLKSLNCYYTNSTDPQEGPKNVNCVIHLGPASVTKSADYRNWMTRFGGAQHIMAGHEMKNIEIPILRSSARITARLNYVCPHLFPSPGLLSVQQINNSHPEFISSSEGSSALCDCFSAENLLKFHLRPYAQLGLDRSAVPSLMTPAEIVNDLIVEVPEIIDASKDVSQLWHCSRKAKDINSSMEDNMVMTEEPWMDDSACMPNTDIAKHQVGFSREIETDLGSDIPECLENITREDMEIIFLGTGSSQPSKYRNVSSIFVNLFSKGSILFDCGEGTLGQLKRRFGVKAADEAVKALRFIWISHIHADHHTGLARILALRCELLRGLPHDPLIVIGPRQLKRFLDAYSRLEDLDMQFLDCRHTTEVSWNAIVGTTESSGDGSDHADDEDEFRDLGTVRQSLGNTIFAKYDQMQSYWKRPGSPVDAVVVLPKLLRLREVLHDAGLECLYSFPVVHCPQAYGIVLKAAGRTNTVGKVIPGWKLVYSGDTRPCQSLVDASHGATVLIHEATFEDGMEDEALAKNHSTTEEAVEVGTSAEAYRIILTHFSQRYPKIPVLNETHMDKTCIAFDMMSVNLADLPVLPKILTHLKLLFKNEMAQDESDEVPDMALHH